MGGKGDYAYDRPTPVLRWIMRGDEKVLQQHVERKWLVAGECTFVEGIWKDVEFDNAANG